MELSLLEYSETSVTLRDIVLLMAPSELTKPIGFIIYRVSCIFCDDLFRRVLRIVHGDLLVNDEFEFTTEHVFKSYRSLWGTNVVWRCI